MYLVIFGQRGRLKFWSRVVQGLQGAAMNVNLKGPMTQGRGCKVDS